MVWHFSGQVPLKSTVTCYTSIQAPKTQICIAIEKSRTQMRTYFIIKSIFRQFLRGGSAKCIWQRVFTFWTPFNVHDNLYALRSIRSDLDFTRICLDYQSQKEILHFACTTPSQGVVLTFLKMFSKFIANALKEIFLIKFIR